jgi:nicotinate-nucleotide--dimethylbenzimidazole phosphoribosyltransferase
MKLFNIPPLSKKLEADLQHKINQKTKPLGALGQLEEMALQIGKLQDTLKPELKNPHIVVFAADHGIAKEGISAYPPEVTHQMVLNFINGGAAINVFCRQHCICIKVVDAGVNHDFSDDLTTIIDCKMAKGTKNFLHEPAMSIAQAEACIIEGAAVVRKLFKNGCNVVGFGEMGIGNTASASALMSLICKIPVEDCVGRGTGLSTAEVERKINIIKNALQRNRTNDTPLEQLATFGGFEIAQMCGAMLQAAEYKMLILVDGFISTSAFLVAYAMYPEIKAYTIFCHQSDEQGHKKMLEHLQVRPFLHLNMRLGEGTGIAIAYPLIRSAVHFLNEMASFETAGVSNKEIRSTL